MARADELPPRITLVTLGVADVARSTRFYESVGWRRSPASTDDVTFFPTAAGVTLGIYGRGPLADDVGVDAAGDGFRGVTCAMNVASPDEVDAVFARWVDAGATPVKRPERVFWGGYSGYVADPDGHLWELAHNPGLVPDADGVVRQG